jgi:DNA-binding GntR family transcriptional regulator
MTQRDTRSDRPPSLRITAYEAIKTRILEGGLLPGEALSESEWAEALGISRTPVREAIQLLAQEGLVEVFPKRGTLVARLSVRDVRESFELRQAIEGFAARLAAERRTDEQIAAMRLALEAPRGDGYDRGVDFHTVLVMASDNPHLEQAFSSAEGRIELASRLASSAASHHASDSTHEAILAAIEAGDGDAAEATMRRHLSEHAEHLISQLI